MKEFVCQICANHCNLKVEELEKSKELKVSGNKCPRGEIFAKDEYNGNRAIFYYKIATAFSDIPAVKVATSAPIPNELKFKLIRHLKKLVLKSRPSIGTIIEERPLGLDINIVVTSILD